MAEQSLEFSLLGTMINDPACQFLGIQKIQEPKVFEDAASQLCMKHLMGMFVNQMEIDPFTFQEYLKKQKAYTKIGGDEIFKQVIAHNIGLPNFEQRLVMLNDSFLYRIQAEVATEMLEITKDKSLEPVQAAQMALTKIEESLVGDRSYKITTLGQGLQQLKGIMKMGKLNDTSGTTTGYEELDKWMKFKDGDFGVCLLLL